MKLTDSSIMPYGKYKGKKMSDVPAYYLIWLRDNNKCSPSVAAYVEDNITAINKEIADAEQQRNNRSMLRMMCK